MTVIIPHQDDELKLIKIQKTLLAAFNNNGNIFVRALPLWINIEDFVQNNNLSDLKSIKNSLHRITLSQIIIENNNLYFSVEIETNNETIQEKLPLLKCYKFNNKEAFYQKIKTEDFEELAKTTINLKIFRVGNAHNSNNSWAISDFVWAKLKA